MNSSLQDLINFYDEDLPKEYIKRGSEDIEKQYKDVLSDFPKLNFNSNHDILLIGLPKVKEELKPKLITALKGYFKKNNFI